MALVIIILPQEPDLVRLELEADTPRSYTGQVGITRLSEILSIAHSLVQYGASLDADRPSIKKEAWIESMPPLCHSL